MAVTHHCTESRTILAAIAIGRSILAPFRVAFMPQRS
jgi:hypothetical protein